MNSISVINSCTRMGQKKDGTQIAPHWLLKRGIEKKLRSKCNIFSKQDLEEHIYQHKDKLLNFKNFNIALESMMSESILKNDLTINLGGDHSVGLGSLSGALKTNHDLKVLWIDAHADINTFESSPSGNLHGMPLSFLMNLDQSQHSKTYFNEFQSLNKENIVYLGLRDIDPGELSILESNKIKFYSSKDIENYGMELILEEVKNYLNLNLNDQVHISFDVDALDPRFIPCTGTPVEGGIILEDVIKTFKFIKDNSNLKSFDLVEVNPLIGANIDLEMTYETIERFIDEIINVPTMKDEPLVISNENQTNLY